MENNAVYVLYFFSERNIEMAAETQAQTIMTTPIQSRDHAKGWAGGSLGPPHTFVPKR